MSAFVSPSPRHQITKTFTLVSGLLLFVGITTLTFYMPQWHAPQNAAAAELTDAYLVIDAEVPQTSVYYHGNMIGTTPLSLTREHAASLGLPTSEDVSIETNDWGEGLIFREPQSSATHRLMFKVPESNESGYLRFESPWGSRTKMKEGAKLLNGYRVTFMDRGPPNVGIQLSLDFDQHVRSSAKTLPIRITATNTGKADYSGFTPAMKLFWNGFNSSWRARDTKRVLLPAEWKNIAPGQTVQTIMEIPVPSESGDYSLEAMFCLHVSETTLDRVNGAGVFSDSKLLHVE